MYKIVVALLLILAVNCVHGQQSDSIKSVEPKPIHFKQISPTDKNMSVLLIDVPPDGEFGIFTDSGVCVGAVAYRNQTKVGLAIWGDDSNTPAIDGALKGEPFQLFFANQEGPQQDLDYEILVGDDIYNPDEFVVLRWLEAKFRDPDYGLQSTKPNPFSSTTRSSINLKEAGHIDLSLHDLTGKKILQIASGPQSAGAHQFEINVSTMPTGVYLQVLRMNPKVSKRQLVLVK